VPRLGLTAKILALHQALTEADIAHAFGGALALAFCTEEPRATQDIDVNVFLGTDRIDALIDALPTGVVAVAAKLLGSDERADFLTRVRSDLERIKGRD